MCLIVIVPYVSSRADSDSLNGLDPKWSHSIRIAERIARVPACLNGRLICHITSEVVKCSLSVPVVLETITELQRIEQPN